MSPIVTQARARKELEDVGKTLLIYKERKSFLSQLQRDQARGKQYSKRKTETEK